MYDKNGKKQEKFNRYRYFFQPEAPSGRPAPPATGPHRRNRTAAQAGLWWLSPPAHATARYAGSGCPLPVFNCLIARSYFSPAAETLRPRSVSVSAKPTNLSYRFAPSVGDRDRILVLLVPLPQVVDQFQQREQVRRTADDHLFIISVAPQRRVVLHRQQERRLVRHEP